MSEKSVTQPKVPVEPLAPEVAAPAASKLKPVAPHIKLTAENIGAAQPGKSFVDGNGNVRTDH